MTDTFTGSPIFDQLMDDWEHEFDRPLFGLHIEEHRDAEIPDPNVLPNFNDFTTSFPWEWTVAYWNEQETIVADPWQRSQDGIVEDDEEEVPDRRSISAALALVASPADNAALDKVMNVIFGDKPEEASKPGEFLIFRELAEVDQKVFLQEALIGLREDDVKVTPARMVARAKEIYAKSPIKPMNTDEPETQVIVIEQADIVVEQAEADEEVEQAKFDSFWNSQTSA